MPEVKDAIDAEPNIRDSKHSRKLKMKASKVFPQDGFSLSSLSQGKTNPTKPDCVSDENLRKEKTQLDLILQLLHRKL